MHSPLTRSQIKKLGSDLRKTEHPSIEQLRRLQQFRAIHDEPLARVAEMLMGLGLSPATRIKTTQTILDKVRRETDLSRMQDVAGARVVTVGPIEHQDAVANLIVESFPEAKLIDRRANPSYGYRALHIVVPIDALYVEIQVRTVMQDLWAQIVERVADGWGRSIRYGEEPDEPDRAVHGSWTRRAFIDSMRAFSSSIARMESWPAKLKSEEQELRELSEVLAKKVRAGGKNHSALVHQKRVIARSRAEVSAMRLAAEESEANVRQFLATVSQIEF